jgi:hypothetical protein
MTRRRLTALAVGAGIAAGSLTGLALNAPGIASAQDDATSTEAAPHSGRHHGSHRGPSGMLDALVDDGTITQEQADAMRSRAEAHRAGHGEGDHQMDGQRRGGPKGAMAPGRGAGLDAAASAIGITTDELRDALRSGQSIAAVAEANGVAVDAVIDAMTSEARGRISEMVNRTPGAHRGN